MNVEPTSPQASGTHVAATQPGKGKKTRATKATKVGTTRSAGRGRKKTTDHAEIERMAAAVAESREVVRHDMVATAAYFLAEKRGFEPGHELEDWLAAEAQIMSAQLSKLATQADVP